MVVDTIKRNPFPTAILALGAAWFIMKRRSENNQYTPGRYAEGGSYSNGGGNMVGNVMHAGGNLGNLSVCSQG